MLPPRFLAVFALATCGLATIAAASCTLDDRGTGVGPASSSAASGGAGGTAGTGGTGGTGGAGGKGGTGGTGGAFGMGGMGGSCPTGAATSTGSNLVGVGGGCGTECGTCQNGACCEAPCGDAGDPFCFCPGGCACGFSCPQGGCQTSCSGKSQCDAECDDCFCSDATCRFRCSSVACKVNCQQGSTCESECAASPQGKEKCTCAGGSTCTFRCTTPPCSVACLDNASCALDCNGQGEPGTPSCNLTCSVGNIELCSDGKTLTCNKPCPPKPCD